MLLKESEIRAMFVALGKPDYANASKINKRRLLTKINALPTLEFAKDPSELDKDNVTLFKRISDALQSGEPLEFETEAEEMKTEEKTDPVVTKEKKSKKTAKTPKASSNGEHKKTSPKKDKAELDKFGTRLGSDRAKVNAALGKKPQTITEIVEKAGLEKPFFRKHLKSLIDQGFVEKVDEGFKLVSK